MVDGERLPIRSQTAEVFRSEQCGAREYFNSLSGQGNTIDNRCGRKAGGEVEKATRVRGRNAPSNSLRFLPDPFHGADLEDRRWWKGVKKNHKYPSMYWLVSFRFCILALSRNSGPHRRHHRETSNSFVVL